MDAHDPDHIVILSEDLRTAHIRTAASEPVDKVDEVEKASVTGFLVLSCSFEQHPQIRLSFGSARQSSDITVITSLGKELPYKFIGRCVLCGISPFVEPVKEIAGLLHNGFFIFAHIRLCCKHPHSLIYGYRPVDKPDIRQLICTESAYRRSEDCEHRYILQRIVCYLQKRQHRFDLDSPEVPQTRISISRYPHHGQFIYEDIRPAPGGPHEYNDVSVLDRPVYASLFVVYIEAARLICDQVPDPAGDQPRFILDIVQRLLAIAFFISFTAIGISVCITACCRFRAGISLRRRVLLCSAPHYFIFSRCKIEDMQFHRPPCDTVMLRDRKDGSGVQVFLCRIIEFANLLRHYLSEYEVHCVQDLMPAPEVFI